MQLGQTAIDILLDSVKLTQQIHKDIKEKDPTPEIVDDYWVQETKLAELVDWVNSNPTEKPGKETQEYIRKVLISMRFNRIRKGGAEYQTVLTVWAELEKAGWI
jgi:hypothetical protein